MIKNLPRLELASSTLADWLDKQDQESWWLVDGDPLLTGNLSFPCTGDILAQELRRINQPLLLIPPDTAGLDPSDRFMSLVDLETPCFFQESNRERTFGFRWAESPSRQEWLLIEDRDSAKLARGFDDLKVD